MFWLLLCNFAKEEGGGCWAIYEKAGAGTGERTIDKIPPDVGKVELHQGGACNEKI